MILRIVTATPDDFPAYVDFLEEVAAWLHSHGIRQWAPGLFRTSSDYYANAVATGEVQLAFAGDELVGTYRLLLREPIVWPDVVQDDAVYVHTLAVGRAWAGRSLGRRLLASAEERAVALGRTFVRLDCMADNAFLRDYYVRAGFSDRGAVDARFSAPVGTLRLQRYQKRAATSGSAGQT